MFSALLMMGCSEFADQLPNVCLPTIDQNSLGSGSSISSAATSSESECSSNILSTPGRIATVLKPVETREVESIIVEETDGVDKTEKVRVNLDVIEHCIIPEIMETILNCVEHVDPTKPVKSVRRDGSLGLVPFESPHKESKFTHSVARNIRGISYGYPEKKTSNTDSPEKGKVESKTVVDAKNIIEIADEVVFENFILPTLLKDPISQVREALKYVDPKSADFCVNEKCKANLLKELSLEDCKNSEGAKWMYFFSKLRKCEHFKPSDCLVQLMKSFIKIHPTDPPIFPMDSPYPPRNFFVPKNIISMCLDIFANQLDQAFHEDLIQFFVYELDLNYICVHWNLDGASTCFITINDVSKKKSVKIDLPSSEIDFKSFYKTKMLDRSIEDCLLELSEMHCIEIEYGGYIILKIVRHHVNHYICPKFCILQSTQRNKFENYCDTLPYYLNFVQLSVDGNCFISSDEKYENAEAPECAYLLLQELDDHLYNICTAPYCVHCDPDEDHPDHEETVNKVKHVFDIFKENFLKGPREPDPGLVVSDVGDTPGSKRKSNDPASSNNSDLPPKKPNVPAVLEDNLQVHIQQVTEKV